MRVLVRVSRTAVFTGILIFRDDVVVDVFLPGNARIAVITGMFDNDNYNWRSMTSPGITGLFNTNCLSSGAANLMTCYPGDNTYDGVQTSVSLVSANSPYHGIYTTVSTNGENACISWYYSAHFFSRLG